MSNAWSDEAPFYGGVSVAAAATAFSGYATAYETASALTVTTYAARLSGWPENLEFTIAVIADIHAYYPWMSEERVGDIVDVVNAQSPISPSCSEISVCAHSFVSRYVPPEAGRSRLPELQAPPGVYSILGNHG